jgi:hypothetical protein
MLAGSERFRRERKGTYVHVSLTPFFLTLVCLKLGLLERDLADTFGILQALVSMTFNTWLNLTTCHLKNFGRLMKLCRNACRRSFQNLEKHQLS